MSTSAIQKGILYKALSWTGSYKDGMPVLEFMYANYGNEDT